MGYIYVFENMYYYFVYKRGYIILQLLVKKVQFELVRSYLLFSGNPKIALF